MTRTLRALAWACVSAAILLGGLYALGFGLVTLRLAAEGASAPGGNVQRAALHALVETLAREALLPHVALTLAAWLGLSRWLPRMDASWGSLAASLPACALLAFPIVGAFTFRAWSPGGVADVAGTAALLSGAVALALWLGRRLVPGLGPGRFGASAP
jgi:hypothetical protein